MGKAEGIAMAGAQLGQIIGTLIRCFAVFAALMSLVTAGAHIDQLIKTWCNPDIFGQEPCVGPWLFWNDDGEFSDIWDDSDFADGNTYFANNYGSVFTIVPQNFLVRWGPMVLAILAVTEHIAPMKTGLPYKSPAGMFLFHMFMGMFVCFPCGGNFGIFAAFANFIVAALALTAVFIKSAQSEPLSYGYIAECPIYRWTKLCKSEKVCKILSPIQKVSSLIAAVLIFIVGFFPVMNQMEAWCDNNVGNSSEYSCFGPWIWWYHEDFFKENKNCYAELTDHCEPNMYGSMFTLDLTKLFGIWIPIFVGIAAIAEHLKPVSPGYFTKPVSSFWLHFFSIFFICFPCAGNTGIVCGFCLIVPTLVAFLMIFFCEDDCKTVFSFGPDKISWVNLGGDSEESHSYHR